VIKSKSKSFNLTLAYSEISALVEYLANNGTSLEHVTHGASYSASAHGITIQFGFERDADKVWGLVLEATDDDEDDEEDG
jgi:hypothetical protein